MPVATYIYEICLVTHMEVVNDRGLVEVCELCHVAGLVEFCGIDWVDGVWVDLLLGAIVALHEQLAVSQLFHHPAPNEGGDGVPKPDVAFAREVTLALYYPAELESVLCVV